MESELSGWYVTAKDIVRWTETSKRKSEEILPLLVQKLILFSCKPTKIDFPSRDLIQIGGWDGILEVEMGNQFIPVGISGWELGTDNVANKKADGDYRKRTNNSQPLNRQESTFVFVTSRLWTKKNSWEAKRKKEQKWKDVKGINAGDLEVWLAECPPVHRWFANLLGKRTGNLWDLEQGWEALSHITKVSLNPELFTNGRSKEKDELLNQLEQQASVIRVKAQSKNESYGFILAALKSNPYYANKVLVVKNQNAWDWLADSDKPLILVPDDFSPKASGRAVAHGHFVIEALDNQDTTRANIQVDRMPRQERINALIAMGFKKNLAEQIYGDTNGYLEPILRHPKLAPLDQIPVSWNLKISFDVLFAALFATEWDGNNRYDQEALSSLAGIDYAIFEKTIIELSKLSDAPIRLLGSVWQVISKIDMWSLIAPQLSMLHLERLGIVTKKVLGDIDPSFDLAPEERYMASLKGAVPLYSVRLKRWIADSLALLSTYGDYYLNEANLRPSDYVRIWARQIFDTTKDAKGWYSMGEGLPSLAEAAPQEFLSAVEIMSKGEMPSILGLFEVEGNGIFGGCPHAALLWALERISWNKSYLSSTSSALARLSEIDPGGRYGNRPFRSLVDIFIGRVNNTQASHCERIQIIESVLLYQYPEIAWKLLLALLPHNTTVTSGLNQPTYRDWAIETEKTVLVKDYHEYISSITELLFKESEKSFDTRIIDLLENFGKFDTKHQKEFIQLLKSINVETLSITAREKTVNKLREFISQNRKFADAQWAEGEELLIELDGIYDKFELDDVVKKYAYLFDDYFPEMLHPTVDKDFDYKQEEKLITETRISAFENVFEARGFVGIERLIEQCAYPSFIGHSLGLSKYSDIFLGKVKEWIEKDDNKSLDVVRMYFSSKKQDNAWNYVDELLIENLVWSVKIKTNLLLTLPAEERTFAIVEKQNGDIQRDYWNRLYRYAFSSEKSDEAQYVAQKFLENDRPFAALGAVSHYLGGGGIDKLDVNLVANILKRIISAPSDIESPLRPEIHHILLKAIGFIDNSQELSENEIVQIEWAFLPVFQYDDFIPNRLSKIVARDAAFFAQLVVWEYRSKHEKETSQPLDDSMRQRAEMAFILLQKIALIPGDNGNVIDVSSLNQWVDEARKLLQESDRKEIGDDQIGNYLSHSPVGSDGIWPHESVRSVIERVKSPQLDQAMQIGKQNARGITSRSPYDGGEQERDLAANYFQDAKKIELKYPRTAGILRNIAQQYERDAKREDWESELRE